MPVSGVGHVPVPWLWLEALWSSLTETREASYSNYRYYPELLESGILTVEEARQVIRYRETAGGDIEGMTAFYSKDGTPTHADNWPLASYGRALLELGERKRFMRVLRGHTDLYMTPDLHTAYEQITLHESPRRPYADWCVPAQLVTPRMARWSEM